MIFTRKKLLVAAGVFLGVMSADAQQLREDYVICGAESPQFHTMVANWSPESGVSGDDNFYISRVKPHLRFRNSATQVRLDLTAKNDKKLLAWIPINDPDFNALPDGLFDREVFSMWSYVTHYGDWTAPQGRVPGAFLDVAHKNGVAVSSVASIPFGSLQSPYTDMLRGLANLDTDKAAQFMNYYGIDGLGYNSEFSSSTGIVTGVQKFHIALVKKMKEKNPLFENIWYDGTSDYGGIRFDMGLSNHNKKNFGDKDNVCASLFFNYNWNTEYVLNRSEKTAAEINRSPLDLYCGVNMQGGEPGGRSWSLLAQHPLSIGLWGAHSQNMFWESRGEKGSNPEVRQKTYLERIERYFTGGTRNPANCPAIVDRHAYNADNFKWHGMSTFMSARSSLKWNLSEEPFITYFNLGNGKFFNVKGQRRNDNPWYNIGMQDYLPTWRWWFASKLLGNTAADVPATGLDAAFTWDDAYFGGSSVRVSGSSTDEYLHLFKTEYELREGDVITFRYKLRGGTANMDLVLSAKGSEKEGKSYNLLGTSQKADDEEWVERQFEVTSDFNGKELALVALHFTDASHLDLLLGELSVVRGIFSTPDKPVVTSSKMLYNSYAGMDAKLIWNMENDKPAGEPCYNIDVRTAYFNLYAQEEGQDPVLMGSTTSWAGLFFSIPAKEKDAKVRLGVSAVSLDHRSESEIAWTGYQEPTNYIYSDDIEIDKTTIKPDEKFTMGYLDRNHEDGTWTLINTATGAEVYSGTGNSVTVENGLPEIGSYTLRLEGKVGTEVTTREFPGYVQITDFNIGALPEIYTLTANGSENPVSVGVNEQVTMKYTGRKADGASSQGVDLQELRYGVKAADLGLVGKKSFSVAFWLKINKLNAGSTQLLSVANKLDYWPKTDWGWLWSNIDEKGAFEEVTWRGSDWSNNNEIHYKYNDAKLPIGTWVHVAYTFEYNADGDLHGALYINGKKQEVSQWKRSQDYGGAYTDGDPGFLPNPYNITDGQVIAVGGNAHGRNGIDGAIDNFQIWNKVMTDEDVKTSMGTLDPASLPADILAFWDTETMAENDNTFLSAGQKSDVKAGSHSYTSSGGEGQGQFKWEKPKYTSGCPFIAGTAYKVTTVPAWSAPKADMISENGDDEAGEAVLSYDKDGVRKVTLTLANSLGKAQRTYTAITVGKGDGIDKVDNAGEMKVYTVGEDVLVQFAGGGNYTVNVYAVDGRIMATRTANISAGGSMQIHLAESGVYVLSVMKDGKLARTVKLIKK